MRARMARRKRQSPEQPGSNWKLSLPCTRAEAELLNEDVTALAQFDSPPTLMTSEAAPDRADEWRLDAYFDRKPGAEDVALIRQLVPSAGATEPVIEPIDDADWVTISQQGLEPIRAGRFFVHTPAHRSAIPADAIAFEIDAGRAFGTGHHETTTGCLEALDRLKSSGATFRNVLDIGTGTGLLAFSALKLWPAARIAASDIDPVSIEVTSENARINGIGTGRGHGQVELRVAAGLKDQRLRARAPFDLIIANILAGPLITMAPAISAALAPGGRLILAGLLAQQEEAVAGAYRRHRLTTSGRVLLGEWPTLILRKRRTAGRGIAIPPRRAAAA
jgi:ribosomal protein L11 methyltransferase